jgi:tRNA nucleotidyltransferase (CCA-adding enzyme)
VKPAGIEADLSRRDFTVNAMAVEITPGAYGRLLDPLGGRGDVKLRVIRILHDRSFVDDPTRIFRAIRFAVRLGYEIEPWTLVLMRRAVEEGYPALLSPERVLYELRLICREPLVLPMMEAVLAEGLLGAVWSWRAPDSLLPGLKALAERRAGPDLLFAWLLSAMPLTDRFPVTKDERVTAEFIRGFQGRRGRMARLTRMSAVHRLLGNGSNAALAILAAVESAPVAGCISRYLQARAEAAPRIGGAELRALGLRPGPAYGRLLERVRTARLDGRLRSRKDEIACVRRLVRAGKV